MGLLFLKFALFLVGLISFIVGIKAFKLFRKGHLLSLGHGYKSGKSAALGDYQNHIPTSGIAKGIVMAKDGKLYSNSSVSDSEVLLKLKGK